MKPPEEIKHEYEQNHYRKQREQIDARKLDYWGLTESNQDAIRLQCKAEAERYPKLRWTTRVIDSDHEDLVAGFYYNFNSRNLYHRRVDPLPVKAFTEEIAELERIKVANQANIKMLEKDLKEKEKLHRSTLDDFRKEQQLRAKAEKDVERLGKEKYAIQEFVDSAAEDVERYKGQLIKCEKDLSHEKNLAKVATERVEELVKENSKINAELREVGSELWETQKELKELEEWTNQERITLLQDIRTLAMRYS